MEPGDDGRASVLIVDDEQKLADMFTLWLRQTYDVRTVYAGDEVTAELDDVDVVLLDRRMPGRSGDDVLTTIRDHHDDVGVVVVTAVDPGPDVLSLPFDDYLCKPVQHDALVAAIERQLSLREYDDDLRRYVRLETKRHLLERDPVLQNLASSPEWESLRRDRDALAGRLRRTMDDFEDVVEPFVGATAGGRPTDR